MISPMKIERVRRGLSQVQLWKKTGIPQWRISLIERGLPPKPEEAEKLAGFLEEDASKLFHVEPRHTT
jgi:transcriptional regulator with XRE-family HTH domain